MVLRDRLPAQATRSPRPSARRSSDRRSGAAGAGPASARPASTRSDDCTATTPDAVTPGLANPVPSPTRSLQAATSTAPGISRITASVSSVWGQSSCARPAGEAAAGGFRGGQRVGDELGGMCSARRLRRKADGGRTKELPILQSKINNVTDYFVSVRSAVSRGR